MAIPRDSLAVADAPLDLIATCTNMTLCSAEPAGETEGDLAAVALANVAMVPADFAKSNDGGSRRLTWAAKNGVATTAAGTGVCIALSDGVTIHHVADYVDTAVVNPGTVDIGAGYTRTKQPVNI